MSAAAALNPNYNPNKLLDGLLVYLSLKNDAALARAVEVGPPIISKIRTANADVSPALLIRFHEVSGLSIKQLRNMAGDYREHTGVTIKKPRRAAGTAQKISSGVARAM